MKVSKQFLKTNIDKVCDKLLKDYDPDTRKRFKQQNTKIQLIKQCHIDLNKVELTSKEYYIILQKYKDEYDMISHKLEECLELKI